MIWFWFFLAVLVWDAVYIAACFVAGNRGVRLFVKAIVVLAFPVGGILLFAGSSLVYRLLFRWRQGELSIEDLSFRKYKIKTMRAVNVDEELNRVPLSEALLVSHRDDRRAALLGMLKSGEDENALPLLRQSLSNEDIEVSHYAAVALSEAIGDFRRREGALYEAVWGEDGLDVPGAWQYLRFTMSFLQQGRLAGEQAQYEDKSIHVLDRLLDSGAAAVAGEEYAWVIGVYLTRGQNGKAAPWVEKALAQPDGLAVFKAALRYYHRVGDSAGLYALLARVKESPVVLDSELLDTLRFYSAATGEAVGS